MTDTSAPEIPAGVLPAVKVGGARVALPEHRRHDEDIAPPPATGLLAGGNSNEELLSPKARELAEKQKKELYRGRDAQNKQEHSKHFYDHIPARTRFSNTTDVQKQIRLTQPASNYPTGGR